MDGAQVGILEKSNEIGLGCFLESANSSRLEPQIRLEILGNLPDQTLEGQLADEQFGRFLVATNFSEGHGTRTVTMGLLDSSGGWSGFPGCLGCQLLARSLASCRFTSSLLGSCHDYNRSIILASFLG